MYSIHGNCSQLWAAQNNGYNQETIYEYNLRQILKHNLIMQTITEIYMFDGISMIVFINVIYIHIKLHISIVCI